MVTHMDDMEGEHLVWRACQYGYSDVRRQAGHSAVGQEGRKEGRMAGWQEDRPVVAMVIWHAWHVHISSGFTGTFNNQV